ncbi:MAG: electron transfer flavoprotein subunit alpha/FixB family protein [Peptococcaceae bacterium]|nr:electron transfer flavoprotein subunit alpha/FixB family protein [Candidatus Syntrophopropionicum ammoniitolerans]
MSTNSEVWVWAEQRNGKLMDVSLQTLGKALELSQDINGRVAAVLIGDDAGALAEELVSYGAEKVYLVADAQLKNYQSNAYTRIISELIEQYQPEMMLFGANIIGMDLAPAVAARVRTGLTAHCSDLKMETIDGKSQLVATIPGFSGGMIVKISWDEKRPCMATLSSGAAEKPEPDQSRQGEIITVDYQATEEDLKIQTMEMVEKQPAATPVEGAAIVVSGGKGIKSEDDVKLIQELADVLGAAVGGTRPARDAQWVVEDNLIGSSGKTVSPKLFISIGASGAAHYSCGFQKAKYVIAIDKDPQAPIFEVCDLGIQADLNEIVPALIEALKTT